MKQTPLYNEHVKLGGRMVEFGGWNMPVQYSGVIDEHLAVRRSAGLFDVSHMGEFEFKGQDAIACVQHLTSNDVSKLVKGQAHYSLLCNERGTIVDDIIVYRIKDDHILMVVNAANIDKDWAWVDSHKKGNVSVKNNSDDFALIAIQGPKAAEILKPLTDINIDSVKTFYLATGTVCGVKDCIAARTGYTGEDGFEIFCAPSKAAHIWTTLIETGKAKGLKPAGLGARDTLRLEMKYSLYGHEINLDTNPLEAGLGWVTKLNKNCDFIGKTAIEKIKTDGLKRKLVGFQMIDAGIPRDGYKIWSADFSLQNNVQAKACSPTCEIGFVTSGTMSPSLSKGIGAGYVPVANSEIGSKIYIDIRGNKRLAEIIETPFYKK